MIKTIGCSSEPKEIEALYQQAIYELPRLYGATLFDIEEEPQITELSNDSIRVIGPYEVFTPIYNKIGYNKIDESLLKDLVISRLTHAGSKLKLSEYLADSGKKETTVYSIYRFLDRFNKEYKKPLNNLMIFTWY